MLKMKEYTFFPLRNVGEELCEVLNGLKKREDNIVLEEEGKPVGVIVPIEEYRHLQTLLLYYKAGVSYEQTEESSKDEKRSYSLESLLDIIKWIEAGELPE